MKKIYSCFILLLFALISISAFSQTNSGVPLWYPIPADSSAATDFNDRSWQVIGFFNPSASWKTNSDSTTNRLLIKGNDYFNTSFYFMNTDSSGSFSPIEWVNAECLLNIYYDYDPSSESFATIFVYGAVRGNSLVNPSRLNITASNRQLGEDKIIECLAKIPN